MSENMKKNDFLFFSIVIVKYDVNFCCYEL